MKKFINSLHNEKYGAFNPLYLNNGKITISIIRYLGGSVYWISRVMDGQF